MSAEEMKGEISQKLDFESHVEWTVVDILSYTKEDECYRSPTFSVSGSEWHHGIHPNGFTGRNSVGWIGLYLSRERSDGWAPPMTVKFAFGVKKVNGEVEWKGENGSRVFEKGTCWGLDEFLQRSELLERKSELLTSDALTVICTMCVKDFLDCTSRLIELSDDFNKMYISKEGCDCTLKARDNEFPVHRSVLASRSKFFDDKFQADMKDKNTGVVDIDDCHPEAFKDFLKYIYSGKFENSGDITELYKIAHKYHVESLKSACVHFMQYYLSVDNVLDVSALGYRFDDPQLKGKSLEFLGEHFEEVVLTDKWGTLFKKNPDRANELITEMAKTKKDNQNEKK